MVIMVDVLGGEAALEEVGDIRASSCKRLPHKPGRVCSQNDSAGIQLPTAVCAEKGAVGDIYTACMCLSEIEAGLRFLD